MGVSDIVLYAMICSIEQFVNAQAALMRLTRDAPAVAAAGELLEALKAENAQLQVRCCSGAGAL